MADHKGLSPAFLCFAAAVGTITPSSLNPHFKSAYASLCDIWRQIQKHLTDNGLFVTFRTTEDGRTLVGKLVHAASGEFWESFFPLPEAERNPQVIGSWKTYGRRYLLLELLNLCVEGEDDDGNAASHSRSRSEVSGTEPQTISAESAKKAIDLSDVPPCEGPLAGASLKKVWKAGFDATERAYGAEGRRETLKWEALNAMCAALGLESVKDLREGQVPWAIAYLEEWTPEDPSSTPADLHRDDEADAAFVGDEPPPLEDEELPF